MSNEEPKQSREAGTAPARAETGTGAGPSVLAQAVAELIGTFALIYAGVLVLSVGADTLFADGTKNLVAVALAHGLTLAAMISATMQISGGQLNPAVTIGLLLARKVPAVQGGVNIAAQLVGGVLGGVLARASLPSGEDVLPGLPALGGGISLGQGVLVEAILTFFLVFVVFGTGVDPRFGARLGGLAIGFMVTVGILVGGPLTGAAMNPARWLGSAVVSGDYSNALAYTVGPILGGLAAALVWMVFLNERRRYDG